MRLFRPSKKGEFYFSLFLTFWAGVLLAIPPYHWSHELPIAIILMLLIEVTNYRYYDWHPEKSPLFEAVMLVVIMQLIKSDMIVVHKDGKNKTKYKLHTEEIKEKKDENNQSGKAK